MYYIINRLQINMNTLTSIVCEKHFFMLCGIIFGIYLALQKATILTIYIKKILKNMAAQKYSNIFQIMLEGDMKMQTLKKNVISLVGKTRAGKSTCANWISARPMIGCGQIPTTYKNMVVDANSIGNSDRASETLIPNIQQVQQNVSLIDMAGYDDSRNYIGVLGVSHMLKLVFQKAQNIKFIIVINQSDLQASQGKTNCQPFLNFIDMFDFTGISYKTKVKIFSSVSIVISVATYSLKDVIKLLENILKGIQTQNLNYQKKDLIIQLLEHILQQNKIQIFPKAKNGVPSPECHILKNLEQTNWDYLSFHELKKSQKKELVKLPFSKLFNKLQQREKNQFKKEIEQRIKFYEDCQLLFKKILSIPQQKTIEGFQTEQKQNWYRKVINYDQIREQIQSKILDKYNFYQQDQFIIPLSYKQKYAQLKYESKNQQPVGIKLIRLLQKIYKQVELQQKQLDQPYSNFLTRMQVSMKQTLKKIKKIFCVNKKDQKLFIELAFIFLRGFQQFRMLFEINQQLISAAPQKIWDSIKDYFTEHINDIKADFILNMKDEYLNGPQLTKANMKELIEQNQIISQSNVSKQINKDSLKIKQIKIQRTFANILFKEQKFDKALVAFMKLYKKIEKMLNQQYQQGQEYQVEQPANARSQIQSIIKQLKNLKIINYGKIAECLQKLNQQIKALKIYRTIKYIPSAIRCYQMIIKKSPAESKVQNMMNFSEYCNEVGQINKALQILQQAYELCEKPQERQLIKQKVRNINKDPIQQFSKVINSEINNMDDLMEEIDELILDSEWE